MAFWLLKTEKVLLDFSRIFGIVNENLLLLIENHQVILDREHRVSDAHDRDFDFAATILGTGPFL